MVVPPPPVNALKIDDFGDWEPELHKLLKGKGYEDPTMYCLADKVESKYLRPYTEEKERKNQTAVNTIRVIVDGEPMAIGEYLPRLTAVIAKAQDRILYYVPKEIRGDAIQLSKRLREATVQNNT
jgi:hypothetical protein